MRVEPPAPRQRDVLAYIAEVIARRGSPPTIREIGNELGIASTNGVNTPLPPTGLETLAAIARLTRRNGFPPTLEELGAELWLTRRGVHDRLLRLRRKCFVTWHDKSPRTLRIAPAGLRALGVTEAA